MQEANNNGYRARKVGSRDFLLDAFLFIFISELTMYLLPS